MAPRQSRDRRETPTRPGTPLVRDFGRRGGVAAIPIRWDVRTSFDFLFALSDEAGSTEDTPADDRRWLEKAKAELTAQVGEAVRLYGHEICIPFAALAVDRPDVTDAAGFIRLLHATPDRDVVAALLADELRDPASRDRTTRALGGDPVAIDEMMQETALYHPPEKVARYRSLFTDPRDLLAAAREVLVRWLPFYLEVEPRIGAMLQRDYEARAADRATLDAPALIEKTTGGIRWLSEPGVRRVILAPSYFARPYNFVLGGDDWRMYGYPIADTALDGGDPLAPPQSLVRLHRALGDETRLRILRLLRDQDFYLTEIAERLELSKPTIKHHLALLRAAGLVTLVEEGGLSYYSLRRERLDDASGELKRFLVG
jgi:DNA-binding transcriptional ArsR family regulator